MRNPTPQPEPTVTITVFMNGDGADVQVDFRRNPKGWTSVRDALAAVKDKIEREFEHQHRCPARPRDLDASR